MIPKLLDHLKGLASSVRTNKAVNVNSQVLKDAAVLTGRYYFDNCRAEAYRILQDDELLADLDEDWQQLIRLAHGYNAKKSYLKIIRRLLKKTTELTVATHISSGTPKIITQPTISHSEAEQILIATLEQLLPSAALSYQQGLRDLSSSAHRFSYRGTACEFREALRETLDVLAPDDEVSTQTWYKQESGTTGPTMKQKVRYILASRGKNKAQRALSEKSIDLIEHLCGDVARAVYNRASVSTHVHTTRDEVHQMKRYLDAILYDILEIAQNE